MKLELVADALEILAFPFARREPNNRTKYNNLQPGSYNPLSALILLIYANRQSVA